MKSGGDPALTTSNPKLLTTHQVAEYFQVKETTVREWLKRKLMRGRRIGKAWRIEEQELERFATGK